MAGKDADVTITHQYELFLLLSYYSTSVKCFHRSHYECAAQIGCRQQQFVNATHRISCQHSALKLLEICPYWAAEMDLFPPFWSTNSQNYWKDLGRCCTVIVIHKPMFSATKRWTASFTSLILARLSPQLSWLSLSPRRGFPLRLLG